MLSRYAGVWVFSLLILFIGCSRPLCKMENYTNPNGPKYEDQYAASNIVPKETITVVSYNIQFAKKTSKAIEELSKFRELKDADIILLQEMDPDSTKSVAKALRYNYVYFPASIHSKHCKDFGNAILSRWPIENPKKILLPHKRSDNKQRRIAVSGQINIAGTEILVYSIHTETFNLARDKRVNQKRTIVNSVSPNAKYVIVGGDFNSVTERYTTEGLFKSAGFKRVTNGLDFTSYFYLWIFPVVGFNLDHIYARGMTVIGSPGKVMKAKASDHKPVWVKLRLD